MRIENLDPREFKRQPVEALFGVRSRQRQVFDV